MYSVAYAITRSRDLARQALEDTFLRLWQKADGYDPRLAQFETWVVSIARSIALDQVRAHPVPAPEERLALHQPSTADATWPSQHFRLVRQSLRRIIDGMPEAQRRILFMAYFEGMNIAQIAERMSETRASVRARLRLASVHLHQVAANQESPGTAYNEWGR